MAFAFSEVERIDQDGGLYIVLELTDADPSDVAQVLLEGPERMFTFVRFRAEASAGDIDPRIIDTSKPSGPYEPGEIASVVNTAAPAVDERMSVPFVSGGRVGVVCGGTISGADVRVELFIKRGW